MPKLILWKNREINKLRRDMDRLFARLWDDFSMPIPSRVVKGAPFVDLSETESHLVVRAEIPGINPDDLDISMSEDKLTIKGEMRQELDRENESYHRVERRYGTFFRTIQLPYRVMVEDVKATYENGILTIVMPKRKVERGRAFKIRIT